MNKYNTKDKNNQEDIIVKFVKKKNGNADLIKYIVRHISVSNLTNIKSCGVFLAFVADCSYLKKKLYSSNFCKNRFCPMCAWRQAKKDALKISVIMKYLEKEQNKDFIFLTLTAPNVVGDLLPSEILRYNYAFKKLMLKINVKQINKGYIRKLEITYNKKTNTYHPHFHVIMAVNKSYFTDKTYIKQSKWLDMWREVMDCPEITQVDVRRLKKSTAMNEIQEIAKYSAKDSDMLISQNVFDVFYKSLKGRQVLTYNGLFKESNKLYKENKLNKYKEIDTTEYVNFMLYRWGKGEYVEAERRELTAYEQKRVNKQLIDEDEEV